ncbi:MAG: DUF2141 domain-containing protein [Sandaracinaceae bacterium]|nr:MAG: DUF2141 domain-containing protein [Sandaracinaceae bacterium]
MRWLLPCLLLGLLLLAASVPMTDAAAQAGALGDPTEPRRIVATVVTRSDDGRVFCAIWGARDGYPTRREHAVGQAMDRTIEGHRAHCVFEDVPPGEYALAAFHDENANNDLDRNIFGIPSEGTGASNDAYNAFGPPSWDDARFLFGRTEQTRQLRVHIHY